MVLLLLLAACGKKEPEAKAPGRPPAPPSAGSAREPVAASSPEEIHRMIQAKLAGLQPVPAPPAPPAPPAAPRVPPPPPPIEPVMGLSANGSDAMQIPRGWPLVVRLRLHPPSDGALKLPEKEGSWTGLVKIESTIPLTPCARPSGALTLDATGSGEMAWTATAEDLDSLPRGPLKIVATLEAGDAAPGFWKGSARATALVTLLDAPKRPTPAAELDRIFVEADALQARGDLAAAIACVDAGLLKQATEVSLVSLRGRLLAAAGRAEEALASYDKAIELQIRRRKSVLGLMRARDGVAASMAEKK
jgi:hypothetical protein